MRPPPSMEAFPIVESFLNVLASFARNGVRSSLRNTPFRSRSRSRLLFFFIDVLVSVTPHKLYNDWPCTSGSSRKTMTHTDVHLGHTHADNDSSPSTFLTDGRSGRRFWNFVSCTSFYAFVTRHIAAFVDSKFLLLFVSVKCCFTFRMDVIYTDFTTTNIGSVNRKS